MVQLLERDSAEKPGFLKKPGFRVVSSVPARRSVASERLEIRTVLKQRKSG